MDIIFDIVFQTVALSTLIFGMIGIVLSLLLMCSPERLQNLNRRFNSYFDVDKKLIFLDVDIQADHFIYRHHIISGILLIAGSTFFLIFLFFKLDCAKFSDIFFTDFKFLLINEIVLSSSVLIGKLVGISGIILGAVLLFASEKIKSLNNKMASACVTKTLVDKLNTFHRGIDTLFLRHPLVFGLLGLLASIFLISICIVYLLN